MQVITARSNRDEIVSAAEELLGEQARQINALKANRRETLALAALLITAAVLFC